MGSDDPINHAPSNGDLFSQLSNIYLFREVDKQLLRSFMPKLTEISIAPNEYIFHRGDESDGLYLITSGSLSLLANREDGSHDVVSEKSTDGVIGEVGLFTGEPRAHTALSKTAVNLVCIPKAAFQSLVSNNPAVHKQIGMAIQLSLIHI